MTTNGQRVDTPPESTLSTPSLTELEDNDPLAAEAEKDMLARAVLSKPIYMIVATTKCTSQGHTNLGIGLKGALPWPMIKSDMAYFRKATTEGRSPSSPPAASSAPNSVIMGRKTFESIPEKFRPLPGRTNIILTRKSPSDLADEIASTLRRSTEDEADTSVSLHSSESSIKIIAKRKGLDLSDIVVTNMVEAAVDTPSSQTYCIGGAEIYNLFLKSQSLRPRLRILQTEVEKIKEGDGFECDTFWPEPLDGESSAWHRVNSEELSSWTGVKPPQGEHDWVIDEKAGVKIRVRGWESNDT